MDGKKLMRKVRRVNFVGFVVAALSSHVAASGTDAALHGTKPKQSDELLTAEHRNHAASRVAP